LFIQEYEIMKNIVFCFLFVACFAVNGFAYDIQKIRRDYVEAIKNADVADKLYKDLKAIKNPSPLIMAYLGSADAVRAKHSWNPVNKMAFLKQGCKTIDKAVELSPNQLEIRFLRFSLEHFLPPFLGYSKHLEIDKKKILELVQKSNVQALHVDETILKNMVNFMIDSKRCSEAEVNVLRKVLA